MISDAAAACPLCGAPRRKEPQPSASPANAVEDAVLFADGPVLITATKCVSQGGTVIPTRSISEIALVRFKPTRSQARGDWNGLMAVATCLAILPLGVLGLILDDGDFQGVNRPTTFLVCLAVLSSVGIAIYIAYFWPPKAFYEVSVVLKGTPREWKHISWRASEEDALLLADNVVKAVSLQGEPVPPLFLRVTIAAPPMHVSSLPGETAQKQERMIAALIRRLEMEREAKL